MCWKQLQVHQRVLAARGLFLGQLLMLHWQCPMPTLDVLLLLSFVRALPLMQDANVIVSENDAGIEHSIDLGPGRQAYMVCIEGSLDVNEVQLSQRDAVELVASTSNPLPLTLRSGAGGSHFMLIEMQQP